MKTEVGSIGRNVENGSIPRSAMLLPGEPMPRQVIYDAENPNGRPGKQFVMWSPDIPIPIDPDLLGTPEQRFQEY